MCDEFMMRVILTTIGIDVIRKNVPCANMNAREKKIGKYLRKEFDLHRLRIHSCHHLAGFFKHVGVLSCQLLICKFKLLSSALHCVLALSPAVADKYITIRTPNPSGQVMSTTVLRRDQAKGIYNVEVWDVIVRVRERGVRMEGRGE